MNGLKKARARVVIHTLRWHWPGIELDKRPGMRYWLLHSNQSECLRTVQTTSQYSTEEDHKTNDYTQ